MTLLSPTIFQNNSWNLGTLGTNNFGFGALDFSNSFSFNWLDNLWSTGSNNNRALGSLGNIDLFGGFNSGLGGGNDWFGLGDNNWLNSGLGLVGTAGLFPSFPSRPEWLNFGASSDDNTPSNITNTGLDGRQEHWLLHATNDELSYDQKILQTALKLKKEFPEIALTATEVASNLKGVMEGESGNDAQRIGPVITQGMPTDNGTRPGGLIQFTETTARDMGRNLSDILAMNKNDQMDVVYEYFVQRSAPYKGKKNDQGQYYVDGTLDSLYMTVFGGNPSVAKSKGDGYNTGHTMTAKIREHWLTDAKNDIIAAANNIGSAITGSATNTALT